MVADEFVVLTYRWPYVLVVVSTDWRIYLHSCWGLGRSYWRTGRPCSASCTVLLPQRPLTSRHRCDMPVSWSHLSTADFHLVRLSSTTSFFICLFRSLSISSAGFSRRFRSRSSASDLADAGSVGWKCRMRPVGMKRPLASITTFLKVFSACSTVFFRQLLQGIRRRLHRNVPSPLFMLM